MVFSEYPVEKRENMRGGNGTAVLNDLLCGNKIPNLRLFSLITLEKDCSIGEHVHQGESEIFYIISGNGEVFDNGKTFVLNAGDCHLCTSGGSHSLKNNYDQPLKVLAAIITA